MGDKGVYHRLTTSPVRDISVLVFDQTARSVIPKSRHIRTFADVHSKALNKATNVFVVATAVELPIVAEFVKDAHEHKRLRGLLIRQEKYQNWIPQVLHRANLRLLSNLLVHSNNAVVRRVLTAWSYGAQQHLIADAAVIGDKLLVRDCALNQYEIAFGDIRALSRIPIRKRTDFIVADDGERISWREYDLDINLESVKTAIDPAPSKKISQEHDKLLGAAIRKLREQHELRQYEIPGLDERHLRRIESGLQRITSKSCEQLAKAHHMQLKDYLNTIGRQSN